MAEMIRFFTFSQFHNKRPIAGSTHIRVNQLLKYWPEAGLYKYGENPDVLVFQKVYVNVDYRFPEHFKGIKILDICDPDWFNGVTDIAETAQLMDAITCPTEAIADFMRQLTDKPVKVIKDRFDMDCVPPPKTHRGKAKSVVWFGYIHNAEVLRHALQAIFDHKLKLIIISNDDPLAFRWAINETVANHIKSKYTFIKYDEDTIYQDLQKADFAILPKGNRPEDAFKSENKAVKCILAGLPVATNIDDVDTYMKAENRQQFVDKELEPVKTQYDVKLSVQEYKELIHEVEANRR